MRLLDTTTGEFHWVNNPREVRYAALSHVWSKQESDGENYVPEQTYQEVLKIQRSAKAKDEVPLTRLSEKIRMACEIARTHGFEYIWIDSCCIDQSSSAELSEAINSMYEWYSCSNLCYAYLKDVTVKEEPGAHHADFPRSEWFRRGWTLQELIAPQNVLFLSDDWNDIGTKHSLAATIANVTKIDIEVLKHDKTPAAVPVAERMAWASSRVTTKEEDKAYCLVGLFGANITPMYGEGQNAFRRLQEAILRHEPDQSIFVWGSCIPASLLSHLSTDCKFDPRTPTSYLLAPSPNSYQASQRRTPDRPTITTPRFISTIPRTELAYKLRLPSLDHPHYTITSSGIRTKLPILRYQYQHATGNTIVYLLAILACADGDGSLLALLLHPVERQDSGMQHDSAQTATPIPDSVMFVGAPAVGEVATGTCCRLVALPNQTLHDCMSNSTIEEKEVYIKHCPDLFMREDYRGTSRAGIALVYDIDESPFEVKLSQWSQHILTTRQGYFVDTQHKGGSQRHYDIELKKGHDYILVTFERCLVCTTDVPIFSSGSSSKPQWPFRVVVKERLNSDTTGADCNLEHIDKWKIQNGIASTSFKLRQRSDGQVRYLRISLSLRKPPAAGEGRVYHGYQHIMDIELLMHPPPRSETSSRTVDRVQSETRTVTLPHRPDYPNITQTVPFDYMPSPISSIDGPQSFPFADSGRPQPTTNLPPMNGWQQQYQIGPEYGGGPVRHDTLHVRGRSTLPAPRHTSSQLRTVSRQYGVSPEELEQALSYVRASQQPQDFLHISHGDMRRMNEADVVQRQERRHPGEIRWNTLIRAGTNGQPAIGISESYGAPQDRSETGAPITPPTSDLSHLQPYIASKSPRNPAARRKNSQYYDISPERPTYRTESPFQLDGAPSYEPHGDGLWQPSVFVDTVSPGVLVPQDMRPDPTQRPQVITSERIHSGMEHQPVSSRNTLRVATDMAGRSRPTYPVVPQNDLTRSGTASSRTYTTDNETSRARVPVANRRPGPHVTATLGVAPRERPEAPAAPVHLPVDAPLAPPNLTTGINSQQQPDTPSNSIGRSHTGRTQTPYSDGHTLQADVPLLRKMGQSKRRGIFGRLLFWRKQRLDMIT